MEVYQLGGVLGGGVCFVRNYFRRCFMGSSRMIINITNPIGLIIALYLGPEGLPFQDPSKSERLP